MRINDEKIKGRAVALLARSANYERQKSLPVFAPLMAQHAWLGRSCLFGLSRAALSVSEHRFEKMVRACKPELTLAPPQLVALASKTATEGLAALDPQIEFLPTDDSSTSQLNITQPDGAVNVFRVPNNPLFRFNHSPGGHGTES